MKNPFRTRYAVQSDPFVVTCDPDMKAWVVVYRKWWQRNWHYAQWDYDLFGKFPKFHFSKEDAIASMQRTLLN